MPPSIDTILAHIIEQRLAGESPDVDLILDEHPEQADEIRVRLADLEKLQGLWSGPGGEVDAAGLPSLPHTLPGGTRLGEFEIDRPLGRGGMGVVYLARQKSLKRTVALKVIPKAVSLSPATRQRFLREAEAMASLSHPNIVPVFAAGESDDALFIAMEYVEGASLAEVLAAVRRCPEGRRPSEVWSAALTTADDGGQSDADDPAATGSSVSCLDKDYLERCCQTIVLVGRALHFAHERGIVHRDVKPGNILIDRENRPRLLDFGLAAINTQPHVTLSGEFFGTPHYVSPEQARAQHDRIGPCADVYSLGATLYECLTMTPPFDAPSVSEVLNQLLSSEARPARKVNPSVPRDLDTVVMKALAKEPNERYSTAEEFAADVERFLAFRPISARPPGPVTRLSRHIRRKPVYGILLLTSVLAVGLGAVAYWFIAKYFTADQQIEASRLYALGEGYQIGSLAGGAPVTRDPAKARAAFESAALLGHTGAMKELALIHSLGVSAERDLDLAISWARRGTEAGDTACTVSLARLLLQQGGHEEEALDLLTRAIADDNAEARRVLGELLLTGTTIPADRPRALMLLEEAARQGDSWAMCTLGSFHGDLSGPSPDLEVARSWYEMAVERGNTLAMVHLASLYLAGNGFPADPDRAIALLRQAVDRKDPEARMRLGSIFLTGAPGVPRDFDRGLELLSAAAAGGDSYAALRLAEEYEMPADGEPQDELARNWYQKAVELGNPFAVVCLARMYWEGRGGEQDRESAVELLTSAAKNGDVDSYYELGMLYLQEGTAETAQKARDFFLTAAELGHDFSMTTLGNLYLQGMGVEQSYEQAIHWFLRAVNLGEPLAMMALAGMYDRGLGVEPDAAKATDLLRQAAATDCPPALVAYGERLERGDGLPAPEAEKARELYLQAARSGNGYGMLQYARCLEEGIGGPEDADQAAYWRAEGNRLFAPGD